MGIKLILPIQQGIHTRSKSISSLILSISYQPVTLSFPKLLTVPVNTNLFNHPFTERTIKCANRDLFTEPLMMWEVNISFTTTYPNNTRQYNTNAVKST